ADAGAADDLQLRRGLDDVRRDLGRGADRDAVILADDLEQLVFRETGLDVGLDAALLEDGDGGRRELVGDQDFGHGGLPSNVSGTDRSRATTCVDRTAWFSAARQSASFAALCGRSARRRTIGRARQPP